MGTVSTSSIDLDSVPVKVFFIIKCEDELQVIALACYEIFCDKYCKSPTHCQWTYAAPPGGL